MSPLIDIPNVLQGIELSPISFELDDTIIDDSVFCAELIVEIDDFFQKNRFHDLEKTSTPDTIFMMNVDLEWKNEAVPTKFFEIKKKDIE